MMRSVIERAEKLAEAQQRRAVQRFADFLISRGLEVELSATEIVVSGRNLLRRWLSEPALRFFDGAKK